MSPEFSDLRPPSFVRSLGYLVSGTVVSQAVQLGGSLLIARVYTPTDFGMYASMLSIAAVLAAVMVLSYPAAIPLAGSDDEAKTIAWLAVLIAVAFATIAALSLVGLTLAGVTVAGVKFDWRVIAFVPLTALSIGILSVLQPLLSRLGHFAHLGRATGTGAFGQVGTQLTLGWLGAGSWGLSTGYLVGRVLNAAQLVRSARLGRPPSWREARRVARAWSEHPRWLMPAVVMNMLGTTAMTPFVAHLYGAATAGAFSMAMLLLLAPAALVGQAVGTILFPKLAQQDRGGGVASAQMRRYATGLALVAFPVFLPFFMLAPELFSVVLGETWGRAGSIASILAPWIAVSFVSAPLGTFGLVKKRYRRILVVAAIETSVRYVALGVGWAAGSDLVGFYLYSATGVAICAYSIGWVLRLSGLSLRRAARTNWLPILWLVGGLFLLLVLRLVSPTWVIATATALLTCFSALYAVHYIRRHA